MAGSSSQSAPDPNEPMDARAIAWMAAVFATALLLRLVYALPRETFPSLNDMGVYHDLATGLLDGTGYVSSLEPHFKAWRAPGYPLFLAGVYSLFGLQPAAVIAVQSVLGATSCALVLEIGRRVLGLGVGVLAGLLCAFDPELVHWTSKFLTETLVVFLVVLFVLSCVAASGRRSRRRSALAAVLSGLCLGAATLVRPNAILLAPVAAAHFATRTEMPRRRRLLLAALVCGLAALVVAPWTIRNYVVLGEVVPVATIGGSALYVSTPLPAERDPVLRMLPIWRLLEAGLHELPNGYKLVPELRGQPPPVELPADFDEVEQSQRGRELYLEYAREHPVDFAKLVSVKASAVLNPLPKAYSPWFHVAYRLGRLNVLMRLATMVLLFATFLFAFLGAWVAHRAGAPQILLHGTWLAFLAMQLVFRPALRYSLPGIAILSIFAAAGMLALRGIGWRRPPPALGSWRPLLAFACWALVLGANTAMQVFVLRRGEIAKEWAELLSLLGLT